tara:strand:+ start:256 stop:561 length:306 start_codon:yes stop_codon:yes gene_type:complete
VEEETKMTDDKTTKVNVTEWFEDAPSFLELTPQVYTVTEWQLWTIWQSRNKVLQELMKTICMLDEEGQMPDWKMRLYEEAYNGNVGGSFSFMLEWVRLLNE